MKLSDRLQTIAEQINKGETMADIGTDHGFLPLYLESCGKCPKVIMSDVSPGSLKKAEENCALFRPGKFYDLRQGDGIQILENGEVDVVVMAGMGGNLMAEILSSNPSKSHSFSRYILQPRNHIGRLRYFLAENGFKITNETLVREGKFICEIITAVPLEEVSQKTGLDFDPENPMWEYPESLLTFKNSLTEEYLKNKLRIEHEILDNIRKNSQNPRYSSKAVNLRIARLEYLYSKIGGTK